MYVHEHSLEARPTGSSSPKFHLTDSPNIILAKFSRYTELFTATIKVLYKISIDPMGQRVHSYKPFGFFFEFPDPVFKLGDLMMNEVAHSTELTHCLLTRQLLDVYRGS